MSLKIRLRPEAETDIESAAVWYERQRKGLGEEFLDEVLNVCKTISENPKAISLSSLTLKYYAAYV